MKKVIVCFSALAVLTAVLVCLFFANGFYIEFYGLDDRTVEYCENPKNDITAYLKGKYFLKDGHRLDVKQTRFVGINTLGEQTEEYRASFLWFKATASRKINVVDTTPPVITLQKTSGSVEYGNEYVEDGFFAEDNVDGDITSRVKVENNGDTFVYSVTDSSGNSSSETRKITFIDTTSPTLTLLGEYQIILIEGDEYTEYGCIATDIKDGDISHKIVVENNVDTSKSGDYTVKYKVLDSAGNSAFLERAVRVDPKPEPPKPVFVPPTEKTIYLTFDDGPSKYTYKLLDVLKEYGVKATFFVVGNPNAELLKRMHEGGHTVALHSYSHKYSEVYASVDAYFADLEKLSSIVEAAIGVRPTLVRFPGGSSNTVSRNYCRGIMTELAKELENRGYAYADWNVSAADTDASGTAEEVYNNIIYGIGNRKFPVVLQHDIKEFSVDAVEDVIKWGIANGYKFDAMNENWPVCHHNIQN